MHKKLNTITLTIIIFLLAFSIRIANYNLTVHNPTKIYFQESDSYYNYRLVNNILNHGYPGDKIINGKEWDIHSYYPPGVPRDYPPLLHYITAVLYSLFSEVCKISLKQFCIWLPPFFGSLTSVAGFLFSRKISGDFGGFITGMLIATYPTYCYRTCLGFFNVNLLYTLLPIILYWIFFEIENCVSLQKKLIYSIFAGFLMFLISLSWNGWIYFFYLVVLSMTIYLVSSSDKKEKIKEIVFPFFVTFFLFLLAFNKLAFYEIFATPITYVHFFSNSNIWYPWPNSYKDVMELRPATMQETIILIFLLVFIFGIIYTKALNDLFPKFTRIMLYSWIISSILLTMKHVKFFLLLFGPSFIFVGAAWKKYENILNHLKIQSKRKIIVIFKIAILFILVLVFYFSINYAKGYKPMYDDYFENAALWIKNNTNNDTVVITSWSYGHFFASESDRPVSFDGRIGYIETLPIRKILYSNTNLSPDVPTTARDYWINVAITTNNTLLSKNILKMLATSGDNGYLLLNNYTHNKTRSFTILNKILTLNRSSAYVTLKKEGIPDEKAKKILNCTHPTTPRNFVLVMTDEMLLSLPFVNITSKNKLDLKNVYSIIKNGSEKIINKNGKYSLVILDDKALIVNKNYRYSICVRAFSQMKIEGFTKVFENKRIKIYEVI